MSDKRTKKELKKIIVDLCKESRALNEKIDNLEGTISDQSKMIRVRDNTIHNLSLSITKAKAIAHSLVDASIDKLVVVKEKHYPNRVETWVHEGGQDGD